MCIKFDHYVRNSNMNSSILRYEKFKFNKCIQVQLFCSFMIIKWQIIEFQIYLGTSYLETTSPYRRRRIFPYTCNHNNISNNYLYELYSIQQHYYYYYHYL